MNWTVLLYVAGIALFAFIAVRMIRANAANFTKKNFGKTLYTLGLLTLMIVAVIAFAVLMLKSG